MASIARRVTLWSLGLALLLVAAIMISLVFAGDAFYRWAADAILEDALERKVEIDGTFSLDPGLKPTLVVTDLWIGNPPWAQKTEMARVKRFEVQVALKPLFSGIVHLPRLVLEGLTLELETGPDGTGNWQRVKTRVEDGESTEKKRPFYPLLEIVSLKDVSVAYRDEKSGRVTEVVLGSLQTDRVDSDSSFTVKGKGRLNRSKFRINGHFGSLEDALAAVAPYPLALTVDSSGFMAELKGTARNIPHAEGFDMSLTARATSIAQILAIWESDLALKGRVEASARLRGDLQSLSVERFVFDVVEQSGQGLQVKGSVSNLLRGKGLDLRLNAKLGPGIVRPMGDLPKNLQDAVNGVARLDLLGHMTGDLATPVFESLHARVEHRSGAVLSLQGQLSLSSSGGGLSLTGLDATSILSLPSPALWEQGPGTELPDLGAIHATTELSWKDDWIVLSSFKAEAGSLPGVRLSAEGRIGKLLKGRVDLEPQLDVSVNIEKSRPLVPVFAGGPARQPERGLKDTPDDLVLLIQRSLKSLGLHPGAADGEMGSHTRSAIEAYQAGHNLSVDGKATEAFLHHLQRSLAADEEQLAGDHLVLMIQRRLNALGLHPGAADGKMGPHTRTAIEDYQAEHDLSVDGKATKALLHHLERRPGIERPPATLDVDRGQWRISKTLDALPELGPIRASARLSGRQGTYRLDGLRFASGGKNTLSVTASGGLKALRVGQAHPLSGLSLQVAFGLPSSKMLSPWIPSKVPELKEITGHFDVVGSPEALSISKLRIEANGPEGLTGSAAGQLGTLSLTPTVAMNGLDVELSVRAPGTVRFSRLAGVRIPDLGAFQAKAVLGNRGDVFTLRGMDVFAGPTGTPTFHATGEIGDLLALKQVAVRGDFMVSVASLLGPEIRSRKPPLGEVQGKFELSNVDGSMGLEYLKAKALNSELYSFSLEGRLDDLAHRRDLTLQVSLEIPDPSTLGHQFGVDVGRLGAFSYTGQASGSDEQFLVEGKAQVGQTELSGTLSGRFEDTRPILNAKLTSPVFHFADFGLLPETDVQDVKKLEETEQGLFSAKPLPFEVLKRFDLDLAILLDQLVGVELDIDKAEVQLSLEDGLLEINRLRFVFIGGSVVGHLVADANEENPKISLQLEADDVDLGDLLAQVAVDIPLDGEVDMVLHLKAVGASPRALTSSLEGDWDTAISRGHVRTSLLDLAALDLVRWMTSDAARKGYSDLNCFVLRIDYHEGVGKLRKQLLDTTNVLAEGTGDIDLRKEIIDVEVQPHAKRTQLISLTTPFYIEGPLASPSVEVGGVTARMVGEVVLAPVHVLGSVLLPLVHDHGKDLENPCLVLRAGEPGE